MKQLTLDKELLNQDLKEYFERKALIDKLTDENKLLNAKIVKQLEEQQVKKYDSGEYSVTLAYSEKIKYNDEKALIDLLKQDDTLRSFVVETINSKALNDLIKKSESVATRLQESYTKTTSTTLTVKKD